MIEQLTVDRTILSADRITELLELCLKSTYFGYQGVFYKQLEGAAMGSPVSAACGSKFVYGIF